MPLDRGAGAAPSLLDGKVGILLRDELAVTREERFGGREEAQGRPRILDVGPQPASGNR